MELRKNTIDLLSMFYQDETTLRLLYYKPADGLDDPLDTSKTNILDMSDDEKWSIINDRIVSAPKFDDLDTVSKCRLLVYPGYGRSSNNNYLYSNQEYYFEVYTHFDFENMDQRLEWICDRLNELLFNKQIIGFGKSKFKSRQPVSAPKNYLGYRLIYEFVNENY